MNTVTEKSNTIEEKDNMLLTYFQCKRCKIPYLEMHSSIFFTYSSSIFSDSHFVFESCTSII